MTGIKFRNILLSIVFIAILSFPIVNAKLNLVQDIASSENRQMATEPNLELKLLDPFPSKYEKYYTDHFTIRSVLIKYFNLFKLKLYKKSPIPDQVLIGNDGWLFLVGNELDSYRGTKRFTNAELESFRLELEFRKKYLEKRGCKFYFMIAPVKSNIYPEKIPENIYQINSQSWEEQLNEYLEKTSSINLINAHGVLMDAKKNETVYYKLDNHWNKIGAFYVANEILSRMKIDFPSIKTGSIDEYTISKKIVKGGNIVGMLADTNLFEDDYFTLNPKNGYAAQDVAPFGYAPPKDFPYPIDYENVREIENSKKPRLLIVSDSYGNNLFPFLSENFSRSVKIFDGWQYKLNEEIVLSEKPDIVLLVALESNVRSILNNQSRLKINLNDVKDQLIIGK